MPDFAYDQNRPRVPIRLWNGEQKVTISGLLDTGADVSVFHRADLPLLGLDWEDGRACSAENPDGSLFRVREFTLEVEIADQRFPARVQFADGGSDYRLIGRADIFRRFVITFDEAVQLVRFETRER